MIQSSKRIAVVLLIATFLSASSAPIIAQDAGDLTAEEVIAFCRANMARFKTPRTVVFGPLPKTSTGKIQKYVLRERAKSLGAAAG